MDNRTYLLRMEREACEQGMPRDFLEEAIAIADEGVGQVQPSRAHVMAAIEAWRLLARTLARSDVDGTPRYRVTRLRPRCLTVRG